MLLLAVPIDVDKLSLIETFPLEKGERSGRGRCRKLELVGIQQTTPHFVVNIEADITLANVWYVI